MANGSIVSRLLKMKILGATVIGAGVIFVSGIIFWGAFNTAMEATNTLPFCISCHEMRDNVFKEYEKTIHYTNRSGVRATCSDCHVPRDWVHKTVRKIQASGELLHKALGSVDTPEKFDAKRLTLAKRVWATMKGTDSRECRNCHAFDQMNPGVQKQRARKQHENAQADGNTCIDCHKGIAHKPVHQLLPEDELRELEKPVKPAAKVAAPAPSAPAATASSAAPAAASSSGSSSGGALAMRSIDWSKVAEAKTVLFYPGQTGIEWIMTGTDHGGARAYKKGDNCAGCHKEETADMGAKMVSGSKAETKPIPGKRAAIPMAIKAAYDADNLYMQFEFPAAAAGQGPRMDAQNEIKLAMMVAGNVQGAAINGCWSTCHMDARDMPNAPGGKTVTKYIAESRTKFDPATRDAWDKLKPQAELDALMAAGTFMDLTRFASSGASEQGYVLAERVLNPAKDVVYAGKKEGDKWVVTMVRRLKGSQPGEVTMEAGKAYTVGFAIHDDYTQGRFHHVSVDLQLGLGADGDIKASKL